MAGWLFVVPIMTASLPIVFDNTVIHDVLKFYLPAFIMETAMLRLLTCSSYVVVLATLAVIQAVHLFCSVLIFVVESACFLEQSYIPGNV